MPPIVPIVPLDAALRADPRLGRALETHGWCLLRGLSTSERSRLGQCDESAAAFFERPRRAKERVRPAGMLAGRARLPLAGLGWHLVLGEGGGIQREHLHLLADPAALSLIAWPRMPAALRQHAAKACELLGSLCSRVLHSLAPACESMRRSQLAAHGDLSVLDLFLYPNADATVPNMRTHTDPGLLTATAVSATPGLEVLDGESGEWVDAEVVCAAGDVVLMCGEALEVMTRGRFRACAHRVRHAPTPRISVVFELRLHDAVPLAPPRKRTRADALGRVEAAQGARDDGASREDAAALAYVTGFVASRRAAGNSIESILREFHVDGDTWPRAAETLSTPALGALLLRWVRARREEEEARQAFESAEYVRVTPAFADCTGAYVDVVVPRGTAVLRQDARV